MIVVTPRQYMVFSMSNGSPCVNGALVLTRQPVGRVLA